ncbi:MAG: hypothetical protein E7B59_11900 [Enterobacteriaceae bacterium]|nr:hypothetical protein [Enterobacteriaceae bacterium]
MRFGGQWGAQAEALCVVMPDGGCALSGLQGYVIYPAHALAVLPP